MTDQSLDWTLKKLAEIVGAVLIADSQHESTVFRQIATLDQAGPNDISFLANPKYHHQLSSTRAGAVIMSESIPNARFAILLTPEPYLAMTRLLTLFHKPGLPKSGIHPTAVVGDDCIVSENVRIAAHVTIGDGVTIGSGSTLFPGVVIGDRSSIGRDCVLHSNVSIYHGITLGDRVIIHANTVIGSDGFGYAREASRYVKIPQVGGVIVCDDVEIGAGCTIDRGSLGTTVIGARSKLDNLIQIAHNVQIGEDTIIVAQTGVSGSTRIGNRVTIAGQVGVGGHIEIGDDSTITAKCGVMKSVKPGTVLSGFPPAPHKEWLKNQGILSKAQDMRNLIKDLSSRVQSLESKSDE